MMAHVDYNNNRNKRLLNIPPQKLSKSDYQIELMPEMTEAQFDELQIEPWEIPANVIRIYKRGRQPLAYFRQMSHTPGTEPKGIELGLTETEIEDLEFPTDESFIITSAQYPEMVEKAKFRCGLTSNRLGNGVAWLFSIGCGITTALTMAAIFTSLPLFIVSGLVMFAATTFANYRMGRFDIPEAIMHPFKFLYTNKKRDLDGNYKEQQVSILRKIGLTIGILGSLGFGLAIGILTANAIATMPSVLGAFGLTITGAVAAILPPVGIIIGAVTVASLSVIMIKAFSNLVKNKHILENAKDTIKNLFLRKPEEKHKSTPRFVLERVLAGLSLTVLTTAGLALAYWGAYATLESCVSGLHNLFKLSSGVNYVISNILIRGLGMVAQIPFTFQVTMNTILYFFVRQPTPKPQTHMDVEVIERNESAPESKMVLLEQEHQRRPLDTSIAQKADGFFGAIASFVNAVGNGMLARNGQPFNPITLLAVGGAFLNSFFSTLGNTLSIVIPKFWKQDGDLYHGSGSDANNGEFTSPNKGQGTTFIYQRMGNQGNNRIYSNLESSESKLERQQPVNNNLAPVNNKNNDSVVIVLETPPSQPGSARPMKRF